MDYKRIDDLLDRYWKLELTDHEEQELKELIKHPSLPDKYKQAALMFAYFQQEQSKALDEDFDFQIIDQINQSAEKPFTMTIRWVWRIAAAIVVVVITTIFLIQLNKNQPDQVVMQDTFEDPETAYLETKKALLMVSRHLNKGEDVVSELSVFNEATRRIENY